MSTITLPEEKTAQPVAQDGEQPALPIVLTPKAALEVKRIISEQQPGEDPTAKIHLRIRVLGGGCSGLQHKLDLDPQVNPKMDDTFEAHGVPIVIDRRSMMYLPGTIVDFIDEISQRGFKITPVGAKTTCGCGSSFSM